MNHLFGWSNVRKMISSSLFLFYSSCSQSKRRCSFILAGPRKCLHLSWASVLLVRDLHRCRRSEIGIQSEIKLCPSIDNVYPSLTKYSPTCTKLQQGTGCSQHQNRLLGEVKLNKRRAEHVCISLQAFKTFLFIYTSNHIKSPFLTR